jgi:Glycerol kinase
VASLRHLQNTILFLFPVWLDARTTSTLEKILEVVPNKNKNYLAPLCGLPLSPYFSALKINWLMNNVPKVKEAIDQNRCCIGTVDTWIIWVRNRFRFIWTRKRIRISLIHPLGQWPLNLSLRVDLLCMAGKRIVNSLYKMSTHSQRS